MSEVQSSQAQSSQVPTEKSEQIVIAGPTASGKTVAAVELYRHAANQPTWLPCSQAMTRRDLEKLFKRIQ